MTRTKSVRKSVAVMLAVVMTITASGTTLAQAKQLSDQPNPPDAGQSSAMPARPDGFSVPEPEIVGELEDKREEAVKQFLMSDGSIIAAVYEKPVHYQEEGKWTDIDNSLSDEPASDSEDVEGLTNIRNDFKVKFAKKGSSKKLVTLKKGSQKLSWQIVEANSKDLKRGQKLKALSNDGEDKTQLTGQADSLTYEDILPNVDIKYTVVSKTVKEDIILKNKDAQREYQLLFDTKKLEMRKNADNSIDVTDPKQPDEVLFRLNAPYVYDAKLESTTAVEVKLEPQKKGALLTMVIDEEWLNSPEREFPVTLDPVVQTDIAQSSIVDAVMYSNAPNTADANSMLNRAGAFRSNSGGAAKTSRSLIKFTLPTLPISARVVEATMCLRSAPGNTIQNNTVTDYGYSYWPLAGTDTNGATRYAVKKTIGAYNVNAGWSASTATWNNMAGKYDPIPADFVKYQYDKNNQVKQWDFNITSIAQDWYTGKANNGVMLKEVDETADVVNKGQSDVYFLSANTTQTNARPTAFIRYLDTKGLEEYWTTTQQDIGGAGTCYINDWTGNLTYVHPTTTGVGERMPVSISHVYNSNASGTDIGFGSGFRLNISQGVKWLSKTSSDQLESKMAKLGYEWRYTDEDGTDIYFFKSEGKWIDETGKGLVLTNDSTTKKQTITDKDGNKLIFNDGPLGEIHDTNGNVIRIEYSGGKPIKVTDPAGKVTTLSYSNGRLSLLTEPTGKSVFFTYHTAADVHQGELLTIYRNDNGLTQLQYGWGIKGMLRAVRDDVSQYAVKYERSVAPFYRISEIKEYANTTYSSETVNTPDANLGQRITVTYDKNETVYRTPGKDAVYGNSDDLLSAYQFDSKGKTLSVNTTSVDKKTQYGAGSTTYTKDNTKTEATTPTLAQAHQVNKVLDSASMGKNVNNLLVNHSFEQNTQSAATGWWLSNAGTPSGDVDYRIDMGGYAGGYSAKLSLDKKSNGFIGIAADVAQAKPNTTYTFSGYVNALYLNGAAGLYVTVANKDGSSNTYSSQQLTSDSLGWQRLSVTFTTPSQFNWVHVYAGFQTASGLLYADAMQVEEGTVANRYNMVENSGFENGQTGWIGSELESGKDAVTTSPNFEGGKAFTFRGNEAKWKFVKQEIPIDMVESQGKTYIVSGWAKNNSGAGPSPLDKDRHMSIAICLSGISTTRWIPKAETNLSSNDWQFTSRAFTIAPDELYSSIHIYLCYYNNVGTATFDNIQVIQESYNSYAYDSKGNVISAAKNAEQKSTMNYNGDNKLIKQTDPKGFDYTYEYQQNTKNLQNAVSAAGVPVSYTYDQYGNPIRTQTGRRLLAYYAFDGNFNNQGTYGGAGTPHGTSFVSGKRGQALHFNGSSSASLASLSVPESFSVSMWVKTVTTANGQAFLDKSDSSGNDIVLLGYYNNAVHAKVHSDGINSGNRSGGWQHLVLTVAKVDSSTTEIQLYKDSVLLGTKRCGGGSVYTGSGKPWTLGADWDNVNGTATLTDYFTGDIDEVAFFDGVLSKKEIDKIKNGINVSDYAPSFETRTPYSADGRFLKGNYNKTSESYTYDETKGLLKTVWGNGTQTNYTYDGNDLLTKAEMKAGDSTYTTSYGYNGKRQLSSLTHNGFSYGFQYDAFGKLLKTTLGSRTLMINTYGGNNSSLLQKALYGNGDYVEYVYDNLGQVTDQKFNGSARFQWQYDSFGNIVKHTDLAGNLTHQYEYDTTGRMQGFWTTGNYQLQGNYKYDPNNNVDRVNYLIGNSSKKMVGDFMYDADNRGTLSMLDSTESRNTYDPNGRLSAHTVREDYDKPEIKAAYTYKNYSGQTGLQTTNRISDIKYYRGTTLTNTFTMLYDTPFNIYSAKESDTGKGATYSYYANKADGGVDYSDYTQLARENNQYSGLTTLYEYDNAGNILRKKEYDYTEGTPSNLRKTVEYTYGDSEWKDLLTAYNGLPIRYDAIGNPTMYLYKWNFGWDGRQMTSAIGYGSNHANNFYKYNADGIRTQKLVDYNKATNYYLDGSRIIREEAEDGSFDFHYDSSGRIQKLVFYRQSTGTTGGVTYFPRYNGFGDVTALLDTSGNVVVRYAYDAWGKVLSVTDGSGNAVTDRYHVGNQNPYRYRGYYYDTETGFYYLQSRYYDPETGRFINADNLVITEDPLGANLFAYCGNNPIEKTDPSGKSATLIIGGLIIGMLALNAFSPSGRQRADAVLKNPNLYNVGNWLTMGAVGTVKGAIMPKKPFSAQHWLDSAATAAMILPGINAASKGVGKIAAKVKAPPVNPGVPFKTGGKLGSIQSGVNPNTLIPKKDLKSLDSTRIKDAVKYAGDKALEVSQNGYIQQGHHRAADAIANGRAVDVVITVMGD